MRKLRTKLVAGAAIGGAAIGGAALANAATTSTTSSSSATTPPAGHAAPSSFPAHGTAAHEDAEKPVTGTAADKAKAAAIKSVGSGTAGEVTTNFMGKGYELTITKPDGSKVEIHLDGSFQVMTTPPTSNGGHGPRDRHGWGMGQGSPGPGSAGGAPPAGYSG